MDFPATIGAGLLAGTGMSAMLYMGIALMPGQMNLLGSMMFRENLMIYMAGAMAHAAMSVVFALIHVGIYEAIDLDSNLVAWGLLFGFVHYMVVGMALGMIPIMHPRIRAGEIQAPWAYALGYPAGTAVGF